MELEVQELAGYTTLVYELKDVIDDIKSGYYSRPYLHIEKNSNNNIIQRQNKKGENLIPIKSGEVKNSDCIWMSDVPLQAPNGDTIATNISMLIKPGMSCLVVGPNGCGKTSLYRILGSLWPNFGGKIHKPPLKDIIYMPQRAYLPKGTLRLYISITHIKRNIVI